MHRSIDGDQGRSPNDVLVELQRQISSAVSAFNEISSRIDKLELEVRSRTSQVVELLPLLQEQTRQLTRIADHFDPPPPDIVGSGYISDRLGCTAVWVTEMVRKERIPPQCVVPGTGFGKPWKFFRSKIDAWLESR